MKENEFLYRGKHLLKGLPMYVQNLTMDVKTIPSLGQSGDYRMTFSLMSGKYHEVIVVAAYGKRCVTV
jgi:hypothetical protein